MKTPNIEAISTTFLNYVQTFQVDGVLPTMMELKRIHTTKVVANAQAIAEGEKFSPLEAELSIIAAWLHDTGRYEQLKQYNTFRDTDSVDHAVFSHDIVQKLGWLKILPTNQADAILNAVLFHNRRDLPDNLDPLTQTVAQTVRDADKLDIFRVLEHQVATTDWQHDCKAFWNLPTTAKPNPKVIEAIQNNRPVDYQNIKSLADFVLIQVGWMRNELYYATSRQLCKSRGHLAFRRNFLHLLTDDPIIDEITKIN